MEQLFGINPPSRLLLRDASGPGSKSSKDHVEQLKPSRVLCYAYIVSQQFIRKGKELCAVDRSCLEGVRSNKKNSPYGSIIEPWSLLGTGNIMYEHK